MGKTRRDDGRSTNYFETSVDALDRILERAERLQKTGVEPWSAFSTAVYDSSLDNLEQGPPPNDEQMDAWILRNDALMILRLLSDPKELEDPESVFRPTLEHIAQQLLRIADGEDPREVLGIRDRRRLRRSLEDMQTARIVLLAYGAFVRREQPAVFEDKEKALGDWDARVSRQTAMRAREAVDRVLQHLRDAAEVGEFMLFAPPEGTDLIRWARLVLRERSRIPNAR